MGYGISKVSSMTFYELLKKDFKDDSTFYETLLKRKLNNNGYRKMEFTGTLPYMISAKENSVTEYMIHGVSEGLGVLQANGKYLIKVSINKTDYDIILGESLKEDEYIRKDSNGGILHKLNGNFEIDLPSIQVEQGLNLISINSESEVTFEISYTNKKKIKYINTSEGEALLTSDKEMIILRR